MSDEILEHINGLIYYCFFYNQDGAYVDEIMEELKVEIEKKLKRKLEWEEIEYTRLEADVCTGNYEIYYSEKELFNILKTMEMNNDNIEDIQITLDMKEHKKRVIKSFFEQDIYLDYLHNN